VSGHARDVVWTVVGTLVCGLGCLLLYGIAAQNAWHP
jgi:hypothetical protein